MPCVDGLLQRVLHVRAGRRDRDRLHPLGHHRLDGGDLALVVGAALALGEDELDLGMVVVPLLRAASTMVSKKSTGNFVMKPIFMASPDAAVPSLAEPVVAAPPESPESSPHAPTPDQETEAEQQRCDAGPSLHGRLLLVMAADCRGARGSDRDGR